MFENKSGVIDYVRSVVQKCSDAKVRDGKPEREEGEFDQETNSAVYFSFFQFFQCLSMFPKKWVFRV